MAAYFLRRVLQIIPTIFGVSVLAFLFVHAIPGNPAIFLAGPNASTATIHALTVQFGLDKPLAVQYWYFLINAVHGDFGKSLGDGQPVLRIIGYHFMPTVELAFFGLGLAVVIGILAGIASAVRRNTSLDYTVMTLSMMGVSFPAFWLAMMLIALFAVHFHLLPSGGDQGWKSFILPVISLGTSGAASIARFTRQSMVTTLTSDYVRTGRAKGLRESILIFKHAFKNALGPIITIIGIQFGFLLGGAVVVEVVYAWPGLGNLLITSVEMRNYPVIQTLLLLFALEFILASLLVDVAYALVNPRVRYD